MRPQYGGEITCILRPRCPFSGVEVSHLEPIPHQAAFRWQLREPGELPIEMPAVRDDPFAERVDPRAEPTILTPFSSAPLGL